MRSIPRPPDAIYNFPRKLDPHTKKEKDEEDKSQILLRLGAERSWDYRLLIGYIASIKHEREDVLSANTDAAYNMQVVCKMPWWSRDDYEIQYIFVRVNAYASGYNPKAYAPYRNISSFKIFGFNEIFARRPTRSFLAGRPNRWLCRSDFFTLSFR